MPNLLSMQAVNLTFFRNYSGFIRSGNCERFIIIIIIIIIISHAIWECLHPISTITHSAIA